MIAMIAGDELKEIVGSKPTPEYLQRIYQSRAHPDILNTMEIDLISVMDEFEEELEDLKLKFARRVDEIRKDDVEGWNRLLRANGVFNYNQMSERVNRQRHSIENKQAMIDRVDRIHLYLRGVLSPHEAMRVMEMVQEVAAARIE